MYDREELFKSVKLGKLELNNRIIRSATHEGMADEDGKPTKELIDTYVAYARGGVGLIISGYIGISRQGKCPLYNMTMLDMDENIPAFRELTDAVHDAGGKVFAQIAHCGRQTRRKITGERTAAPSPVPDFLYCESIPHMLSEDEIYEIIDDFGAAALRAKLAGFDGIQLHCAHGYLLSEFLSPRTNRRHDQWGGSRENRFRIVDEIIKKIRTLTYGDFPIAVKMNCFEKYAEGIKCEEAVEIAKLFDKAGVDLIEVSCGFVSEGFNMSRGGFPYPIMCADNFRYKMLPKFTWPFLKPVMKLIMGSPQPVTMYNVSSAEKIKRAVSAPVAVVGGIRTLNDIATILNSGSADFVSMSRPFIMEPDLVNKFKNGKSYEARCISCNYCLMGAERRPMRCYYGKLPKENR